MRLAAALCLFGLPAAAWEFRPDPLCTLSHTTGTARIEITFDAAGPLYTLRLTRADTPWEASPTFGIAFAGQRPLTIGTSRHQIAGDTLEVQDTGFGNVLDGLEFNDTATAFTGTQSVELPLDGAPVPRLPADAPVLAQLA